mmetsp:Transcript_16327/g.22897  ORF Transcript_16327/g.22897 Transcript_16327/m.22897 type:complete len:101 (-) Transcript_16327:1745-2047(-)
MHERTSQSSDALRANEKRRRLWTHDISEAQNKIPYSIIGIKDIFYIYIYIYIFHMHILSIVIICSSAFLPSFPIISHSELLFLLFIVYRSVPTRQQSWLL